MTMTPFAPRAPYIAVSAGSLRTRIDSMSCGLTPWREPPGPAAIGMPSNTYSGSLLPYTDDAPRMRTARPPSAARPTVTPATRPARIFSTDSVCGVFSIVSAVTVQAVAEFDPSGRAGVGAVSGRPDPPHAAAETARTRITTVRDELFDIIAPSVRCMDSFRE